VYRSLDAWRGVAALAVLNFHLIGFLSGQSQTVWQNRALRLLSHGYVGVEMFFVISGYCIAAACASNRAKGEGVGRFVRARAWRIYPAYWVAFALLLLAGAVWRAFGDPATAAAGLLEEAVRVVPPVVLVGNGLLAQIALGQPNVFSVSWTLAYELAFYLICGASLALLGRRGIGAVLNGLHAVTLATLVLLIAAPQWRAYPLDMWPHFGLGVLLFDLVRGGLNRSGFAPWAAGAAVLLFAVNAAVHPGMPLRAMAHHEALRSGAVVVGFAALLLLLYRHDAVLMRLRGVSWLARLGTFSYSLYLTHYYVIAFWTVFVLGQGRFAGRLLSAQYVALTAACVGLAYLFFVAVERPFLKAGKRVKAPVAPALPLAAAGGAADPVAGVAP
jgi:peptidoglycan/LPS O-acetylase OafA/YrhL